MSDYERKQKNNKGKGKAVDIEDRGELDGNEYVSASRSLLFTDPSIEVVSTRPPAYLGKVR